MGREDGQRVRAEGGPCLAPGLLREVRPEPAGHPLQHITCI